MVETFTDPDDGAIPISTTVFVLALVFSCLVFVILIFAVRFLRIRAINKTKFLNSLIKRVENQMATQQNWTDEALENLAKKIKADMADLHKDRAAFNRIVRGVPEAGESRASALLSSRNPNEFKVPKNAYDEAAFNDPEYATLRMTAAVNNDDLFLHKKDVLSAAKKKSYK